MLCPDVLNFFAEQFNEIKVDGDGITTIEKYAGTTTDITLKNNHIWGCPVYVFDAIFQGNIAGLIKWLTLSRAGIYLCHSSFHAG